MKQTFGAYIREARVNRGYSLRKFSSLIGISAPFVSQMERGLVSSPGEPRIRAMAELLDKNPDELLALTGRVSSDVLNIILQDPIETSALIRRHSHSSKSSKKQSKPVLETGLLEFFPLDKISLEAHTAVIGETGSGKTILTQHLIQKYFKKADIKVYDSDARPSDWKPLTVKGRKANYKEIALEMLNDIEELQLRTELVGDGQDPGREIVRVIEEVPSTAAELAELVLENKTRDVGSLWLRKLLRRGRKYRMKVFAVAQEFEVNAWKIAGEGSLRNAFTVLYLGSTAYTALSAIKDKALHAQLKKHFDSVKYPCLADVKGRYYPVEVPQLGKKT
jgi:transcriptional regulator with XRE-family HTH domain/GTPase SAR1 family protein